MLIPVRCFTCGKVLGNKESTMKKLREEGKEDTEIMEILGITRYCCKRILLTYIDTTDDMFNHSELPEQVEFYDGIKNMRIYDAI